MFGNIGLPEMVLIMAIALLVFGPKKLPEIGRSIGKAMREFKKATEEIKDKFEEQIGVDDLKDIKKDIKDIKTNLSEASPLKSFQDGLSDIQKDINGDKETKKIS
jgi:TatA/E family protein of Tat protein translocase